jgi:hypothetical protein
MENKEKEFIEKAKRDLAKVRNTIFDKIDRDLASSDPIVKERASRLLSENFRMEFNEGTKSFREVLSGDKVPANEYGYGTISEDCNIDEYIGVHTTMVLFGLEYTTENVKAIFPYARGTAKVTRIMSGSPTPDEEIEAYQVDREASIALWKVVGKNYPKSDFSDIDHEKVFRASKEAIGW